MITGLILVSIPFAIWLFRRLTRPDPLADMPGPKGVPVLGNILQLNPAPVVHMKLTEWAKEYGPVYRIMIAGKPAVVVSGVKEIYEVLVSKGKDFAGRTGSYRIDMMMENKSDMLSLDYSPDQQFRRKILQSHLKQYGEGVTRIEDVTITIVQDMVQELLASHNKPLDIFPVIQSAIIDITYTLVLGKKQESAREREDIVKLTQHMSDILSASGNGIFLDIFPWLRFFGNDTYSKLLDMKRIRQKLFGLWKQDLKDETDREDNIIYKMFKMMERGEKLTEQNIDVLTMIVFLGATSTTVTTFSCLLNILAHKPEVQAKLQEEVDREMGREGTIRLKDRARLPYHYAVILETLRLTTVLPIGIPHKSICETSVAGYTIPEGCGVWTNLWGLHHDPEIWGDPFSYRPERFMDPDSGQVVGADHPLRQALMPFSAGPRVCTGEMFAQTRMFLMLAMLMQRLSVLPETTVEAQPSYDAREMKLGGVLLPNPFKIRVKERD